MLFSMWFNTRVLVAIAQTVMYIEQFCMMSYMKLSMLRMCGPPLTTYSFAWCANTSSQQHMWMKKSFVEIEKGIKNPKSRSSWTDLDYCSSVSHSLFVGAHFWLCLSNVRELLVLQKTHSQSASNSKDYKNYSLKLRGINSRIAIGNKVASHRNVVLCQTCLLS